MKQQQDDLEAYYAFEDEKYSMAGTPLRKEQWEGVATIQQLEVAVAPFVPNPDVVSPHFMNGDSITRYWERNWATLVTRDGKVMCIDRSTLRPGCRKNGTLLTIGNARLVTTTKLGRALPGDPHSGCMPCLHLSKASVVIRMASFSPDRATALRVTQHEAALREQALHDAAARRLSIVPMRPMPPVSAGLPASPHGVTKSHWW